MGRGFGRSLAHVFRGADLGVRSGRGPGGPSPRRSPIRARTRESESKGESDLLWTRESESKEESDLLWAPEPESKGESGFFHSGVRIWQGIYLVQIY
jgi:hypothetical protein